MCACIINALQGNVQAIKLALGVAILTRRMPSFLANNVSSAIARYSLEWPVNLMSASWFVSEMSVKRLFRWEGKIAFHSRQDQSEC